MLGRGVKRKRCVSEEDRVVGSVDVAHTADSLSGASYLHQRQLVLGLCLDKLHGCQVSPEPSLRRSVLLVNTLRYIQEEMKQEGEEPGVVPASSTASAAVTGGPLHAAAAAAVITPPLSSSPSYGAQAPLPLSSPQDLFDLSGLDGIGSLLTCPGCSEEEEEEEEAELEVSLVSSSFSSSMVSTSLLALDEPLPLSSSSLDSRPVLPSSPRGFHPLVGSFELVNSPGYLPDLALDDIFEDIDTSMYDASDVSSILAMGSSRVTSLSSFSSSSSAVGGGTGDIGVLKAPPPSTCPSSATLQLCFSEVSDLDHIMEVLVGS